MDPLDFIYEALSVAALGLAALSHKRDRRHAVQVAAMLSALCFACNSTRYAEAYWLWPPMDAVAACFVARRYRIQPRRWKLIIVAMYAGQALAHIRWTLGDKFGGPFYGYGLTLNVLFIVQLAAVASSGSDRVRRAFCDYVGDRLGLRRGRRVAVLHRAAHWASQRRRGGGR